MEKNLAIQKHSFVLWTDIDLFVWGSLLLVEKLWLQAIIFLNWNVSVDCLLRNILKSIWRCYIVFCRNGANNFVTYSHCFNFGWIWTHGLNCDCWCCGNANQYQRTFRVFISRATKIQKCSGNDSCYINSQQYSFWNFLAHLLTYLCGVWFTWFKWCKFKWSAI